MFLPTLSIVPLLWFIGWDPGIDVNKVRTSNCRSLHMEYKGTKIHEWINVWLNELMS